MLLHNKTRELKQTREELFKVNKNYYQNKLKNTVIQKKTKVIKWHIKINKEPTRILDVLKIKTANSRQKQTENKKHKA